MVTCAQKPLNLRKAKLARRWQVLVVSTNIGCKDMKRLHIFLLWAWPIWGLCLLLKLQVGDHNCCCGRQPNPGTLFSPDISFGSGRWPSMCSCSSSLLCLGSSTSQAESAGQPVLENQFISPDRLVGRTKLILQQRTQADQTEQASMKFIFWSDQTNADPSKKLGTPR